MKANSSASRRKRSTGGPNIQFPGKLHDMMTYVEQEGLGHIVSWIHNGRGFKIQNSDRLAVEILPHFFSQTQYRSFARQLNMWRFERVTDGCCKGAFVHPYFIRGHRLLCAEMSRHSKLPISSYPIKSKQLEAHWHVTHEMGESSAGYPSRAAISSSPSSFSSSASVPHDDGGTVRMRFVIVGGSIRGDAPHGDAAHEDAGLTLRSSNDDVDSDRKIRATKGEQREFIDGALTYFAGRPFHFLDIDVYQQRIVGPPLQNQEEHHKEGPLELPLKCNPFLRCAEEGQDIPSSTGVAK
jgi:hypothetical protein